MGIMLDMIPNNRVCMVSYCKRILKNWLSNWPTLYWGLIKCMHIVTYVICYVWTFPNVSILSHIVWSTSIVALSPWAFPTKYMQSELKYLLEIMDSYWSKLITWLKCMYNDCSILVTWIKWKYLIGLKWSRVWNDPIRVLQSILQMFWSDWLHFMLCSINMKGPSALVSLHTHTRSSQIVLIVRYRANGSSMLGNVQIPIS